VRHLALRDQYVVECYLVGWSSMLHTSTSDIRSRAFNSDLAHSHMVASTLSSPLALVYGVLWLYLMSLGQLRTARGYLEITIRTNMWISWRSLQHQTLPFWLPLDMHSIVKS
jgi:hypothetical protein